MNVFLGLGSNIGDKKKNLDRAVSLLGQDPKIEVLKKSSYIDTKPYGKLDQPDFLNCVIEIKTTYTPHDLLSRCLSIEKIVGRTQGEKWGPRIIDVDILFYNNKIVNTLNLILPHPEVHKREFALRSLKEIAPNFKHPILKTRMLDLYRLVKSKDTDKETNKD
ncbi:MAG: 2-amino-4-hydroxy-6-hydroxymethyldihydropteridine diphosphokinase [Candidatus Cloacimonetes bacterium]|nr:2-amino-4-hydroxy-6-hydroxymethyldihydropteridine diphosphokinase [Candidatus Cloacimonadota bacterium]